jgi:hypothetical protein
MPQAFTFNEKAPRTRFSDDQILESLRELCARKGGAFTMLEYDAWDGRCCSALTIEVRFKGWRRALAAAGMRARSGQYSREELMEILEETWRKLGRPPGHLTLPRIGKVSVQPYTRAWGSLRNACHRLARFHRGEITRDELVAADPAARPARSLALKVRWSVFKRDGRRCCVCGRSGAEKGVKLEVDHIVPVSKGGTDAMENLRTLCFECNRGKGPRRGAARSGAAPAGGQT